MKVVIRGEDYSVRQYELNAGETVLAFTGVRDSFSFPYEDVRDIVITQDARGKYFFTMICAGKLYEGQITQPQGIEPFARALSKKLGGVIQLEVKKG